MWKVIKFEKNYYQILRSNILNKVGNDCKFYFPQIKIRFVRGSELIKLYPKGEIPLKDHVKFFD